MEIWNIFAVDVNFKTLFLITESFSSSWEEGNGNGSQHESDACRYRRFFARPYVNK